MLFAPTIETANAEAHDSAAWLERHGVVPAGHPLAGQRWTVLPWQRAALDAWDATPPAGIGVLSAARKNGKTAISAGLVAGEVAAAVGRRQAAWTGFLVAPDLRESTLLVHAAAAMLAGAGLPGQVRGSDSGRSVTWRGDCPGDIRFVSLGLTQQTGHAVGADLVVADEIGLWPPAAARWGTLDALRACVVARGGRMLCTGIAAWSAAWDAARDMSEWCHWHTAAPHMDPWSDAAVEAANPSLGYAIQLETLDTIRRKCRPATWNVQHLNRRGTLAAASGTRLVPERMALAFGERASHRPDWSPGGVVLGVDLGGAVAWTALVAIDTRTGRVDSCYAVPWSGDAIANDATATAVSRAGRLWSSRSGDEIPVVPLLDWWAWAMATLGLTPAHVSSMAADSYRMREFASALQQSGWTVPMRWLLRQTAAEATTEGAARCVERMPAWSPAWPDPALAAGLAVAELQGSKVAGRGGQVRIDGVSALVAAASLIPETPSVSSDLGV